MIRTRLNIPEMALVLDGLDCAGVEEGAIFGGDGTAQPAGRLKPKVKRGGRLSKADRAQWRDRFFEAAHRFRYTDVPAVGYVFDCVTSELTEENCEHSLLKLAESFQNESLFDAFSGVAMSH